MKGKEKSLITCDKVAVSYPCSQKAEGRLDSSISMFIVMQVTLTYLGKISLPHCQFIANVRVL